MIRLLDGPAGGRSLACRRAPDWLRVTITDVPLDAGGGVDALDDPLDEPRPDERVVVYRLVLGTRSAVHVCGRGAGGVSGWYGIGDYRHLPEVDGERLRDTDRWREFVAAACGVARDLIERQLADEAAP